MKFLVTVTPSQGGPPIPPGAVAEMLSAQRDWLNQNVENGTLDCAYGFVGGGGMGIANADSAEELHALIVGSPGFVIGDFEVRPLGEVSATIEAGVAALRRVASMMPGPPG
jgi:hypothetical protein